MIGCLRGDVLEKHPPHLLLDVQGVGYELEAPMSTFYELPEAGSSVVLYTHLLVREDAQILYAFKHLQDRALFRDLLKVNGVGAKIALAILSGMDVQAFTDCVHRGDSEALMRLPGVGRRTAERLVIEMRDRLQKISTPQAPGEDQANTQDGGNPVKEAVSALVALGYSLKEARRMVGELDTQGQGSEELIRQALKTCLS